MLIITLPPNTIIVLRMSGASAGATAAAVTAAAVTAPGDGESESRKCRRAKRAKETEATHVPTATAYKPITTGPAPTTVAAHSKSKLDMALEQLAKLQKEVKRSRRSRSRQPREHETSGGDSSDNRGSDSEEKDQTPDDIRRLATRNATQGMLKHRAAGSLVEHASLKVLNELLDKEFPDTTNTPGLANIEALLQQVRATWKIRMECTNTTCWVLK